jgi:membrane-associated protease RseP (regulator of RpoE activity)
MNPYEEPTPEEYPRTFGAKPAWQRALVIFAGPATHFVIAFALFAAWLGVYGPTSDRDPVVGVVERTLDGRRTPAFEAGLRPGDQIVAVGPIKDPTILQLQRYTNRHTGHPIALRIERDGRTLTVRPTPVPHRFGKVTRGVVGVELAPSTKPQGFVASITGGARLVGDYTWLVVKDLGHVFGPSGIGRILHLLTTNAPRKPTDPTSVVGGARLAGQAVQAGQFYAFLLYLALFNVFIGLLNLLPLPPFDGGHLAVIAVEKIRRKKVDVRKLVPLTAAVATFFLLFVGSLIYLDIVKPVPDLFR